MISNPYLSRKFTSLLLSGSLVFIFTGCFSHRQANRHQASSVVQFLYPGKDQPFVQPMIPTLRLPLRVGLAFVPPSTSRGLTELQKTELLREVAAKFRALPFVESIEVVPTTYLRPGGGFENLDQLRSLLGVDVIALIAYDQAQLTSGTAWSLSYWTIVGAYVVPGEKNDTATLMEAVVYDIASRKLLFRASGTSTIKGHATPVENEAMLQADSAKGYAAAAADLTLNLQRELDDFKVRVKQAPETVRIEHKPGYTGGGSLDAWFAALLVLLFLGGRAATRR